MSSEKVGSERVSLFLNIPILVQQFETINSLKRQLELAELEKDRSRVLADLDQNIQVEIQKQQEALSRLGETSRKLREVYRPK